MDSSLIRGSGAIGPPFLTHDPFTPQHEWYFGDQRDGRDSFKTTLCGDGNTWQTNNQRGRLNYPLDCAAPKFARVKSYTTSLPR